MLLLLLVLEPTFSLPIILIDLENVAPVNLVPGHFS